MCVPRACVHMYRRHTHAPLLITITTQPALCSSFILHAISHFARFHSTTLCLYHILATFNIYFGKFQHLHTLWTIKTHYLEDTLQVGKNLKGMFIFFLHLKIVRSIIFYKLRKSIFPFCNASSISIMNMIMFNVFL